MYDAIDSESRLAGLPPAVRERLNATSLTILIETIEGDGYENVGGPLTNRIEWLELKARIAQLCRMIPRESANRT